MCQAWDDTHLERLWSVLNRFSHAAKSFYDGRRTDTLVMFLVSRNGTLEDSIVDHLVQSRKRCAAKLTLDTGLLVQERSKHAEGLPSFEAFMRTLPSRLRDCAPSVKKKLGLSPFARYLQVKLDVAFLTSSRSVQGLQYFPFAVIYVTECVCFRAGLVSTSSVRNMSIKAGGKKLDTALESKKRAMDRFERSRRTTSLLHRAHKSLDSYMEENVSSLTKELYDFEFDKIKTIMLEKAVGLQRVQVFLF